MSSIDLTWGSSIGGPIFDTRSEMIGDFSQSVTAIPEDIISTDQVEANGKAQR